MDRLACCCAAFFLLAPALASAQEPTECTTTTTTTVKCTGDAAPLAVPGPAAAAAPIAPPVAVQPVAPPPVAAPVAPMPMPVMVLPGCVDVGCNHRLDGNWRLSLAADGTLWRERTVRRSRGLWGGGLGLTLSTYFLGAAIMPLNLFGWIPVFGAFTTAAFMGGGVGTALYALDGLLQLGGWVMFIVGVSRSGEKIERQRVSVGPVLLPAGGGLGVSGRF